ncbi:MAG TPA: TRAP transporter small permease [Burkholderiales bacterium]|jgi:TRAP-type C4-dicarboxylate transport system permease small subunit
MNAPEPKWERRVDAALGAASAAILFAMMLLTFADVVARYLFDFPLRGAFEVTELMLLVLIFAGLPLVSHADENVTMDFIDHMLPEPALRVLERAVHVLCAAVFFFLAWLIWLKAGKIAAYGDTTDVMKILVAPFVYFMTAAIALTGAVHLIKVFILPKRREPQATL